LTIMQKKNKNKIKNISLSILQELVRFLEFSRDIFLDQKSFFKKYYTDKYECDRFFDRLKNLQKSGYIKINDKNNSIEILNKGKIKLLENNNLNIKDGKWRMISFDIPEKLRFKRNHFRSFIKRVGFEKVQASLWACPFIKADDVTLIIDELKINKYVIYMIVEKTDSEKYIKKLFRAT